MTAPRPEPTGVLLLAYGGPLSLDEVEPFLADIRGGRPTPPDLLEEIRSHYAAIGGRSPLLDNTRRQAAALEEALAARAAPWPVAIGMRHWRPRVADALRELVGSGVTRLVAICLAPHYSRASVGAYRRALDEAMAQDGRRIDVRFVERWGTHPRFVAALADRLEVELATVAPPYRRDAAVVFTAHSLPARLADEGDPYPQEVEETARAVARRAGLTRWRVAYQSAGARAVDWLRPEIGDLLEELSAEGARCVVVQPVGFVSDHVETLYDLDIEARRRAQALGLAFHRVPAGGDHPDLIAALADLVLSRA